MACSGRNGATTRTASGGGAGHLARLCRKAARARRSGFESGANPPKASSRVMNLSIESFFTNTSFLLAGSVIAAQQLSSNRRKTSPQFRFRDCVGAEPTHVLCDPGGRTGEGFQGGS